MTRPLRRKGLAFAKRAAPHKHGTLRVAPCSDPDPTLPMRVHWLQHAEHEDPGCITPWLAQRDAAVSKICLPAGDALPAVDDFDTLIVMGGPMNIYEHARYPWLQPETQLIRDAIAAGRKVLGICLGSQLIADALGAPVTRNPHPEIGWFDVSLNAVGTAHPLLRDWPQTFTAFHWHGDTFAIPPGAQNFAHSEACAHQGFFYGENVLALQFHLEVTAADARRWFEVNTPVAATYVQTPEFVLPRVGDFALNNRLMCRLLERFLG